MYRQRREVWKEKVYLLTGPKIGLQIAHRAITEVPGLSQVAGVSSEGQICARAFIEDSVGKSGPGKQLRIGQFE